MNIDIQFKIRSDKRLLTYIREYPYWYKVLNRNPSSFNDFVNSMKSTYSLTYEDKINKTISSINTFRTVLDIIK